MADAHEIIKRAFMTPGEVADHHVQKVEDEGKAFKHYSAEHHARLEGEGANYRNHTIKLP